MSNNKLHFQPTFLTENTELNTGRRDDLRRILKIEYYGSVKWIPVALTAPPHNGIWKWKMHHSTLDINEQQCTNNIYKILN